ncbi:MAG: hypothetical protein ACM3JG_04595 [Thiohalocapsa sp.]
MRLIENLLRARRRQCEEQRRYVGELEQLAQRLAADALRLRVEIGQDSAADPAVRAALLERRTTVERSVIAIEHQLGEARAALAEAAHELQRSELALAQRTAGGLGDGGAPRRGRRARRPRPGSMSSD